jgi:integrase
MGRHRTKNRHLPPRVQLKGKAYYLTVYKDGKVKWIRLGDNYGDALRRYAEIEGRNFDALTVSGLIDRFLRDHVPTLAEPTQREYRRCAGPLRAVFGDMALDEVRKSDIAGYLSQHKHPPQANHDIAMLSSVFRQAIKWGMYESSNPCTGVPRNSIKTDVRAMSHAELDRLRKHADEQVRCILDLAYLTALRKADLLKIRLADIQPEGLAVKVQKTGPAILFEKCPELDAILDRARGLRRKVGSMYLFANRKGQPYTTSGFDSIFQRVARKAGVTGVGMHGIRRLRLIEAERAHGMKFAQALAAHKSAATTEIYLRDRVAKVVSLG